MGSYPTRTLSDKLGIKSGMTVLVSYQPRDVDLVPLLEPLPENVRLRLRAGSAPVDLILCIAESLAQLVERLSRSKSRVTASGTIWVMWPKKSSQRFSQGAGDLTEDVVRELALDSGLVDVKVCAVDDTWSGLKLVRRLKDR